jgi:radical SAM protein with 4Fe4S-binding SPASM domain
MESVDQIKSRLPKNFCSVPFTTLLLDPAGNIGICRHHGQQTFIGNIQNNTILEIWNSPKAKQWRRDFLENKIRICDPLLFDRHCNLDENWLELLPHAQIAETQTVPFIRLTANLNGQCNLKCQTCHVWEMPNGRYTEENFWRPAKESIFPHLKYVDMLGGEPFIQKDTFRLMDEVFELNPSCAWDITTNMHWQFRDKILDYIQQLNFKNINISIDSLKPEVFNKIRTPGRLDIVLKNLDHLLAAREKKADTFKICLNCVVQKDNWTEYKDILAFCRERNIHPHFFHVRDPFRFSLLDWDMQQRLDILDFYFGSLRPDEIPPLHRVLMPLINSMPREIKATHMLQYHEALEKNKATRCEKTPLDIPPT